MNKITPIGQAKIFLISGILFGLTLQSCGSTRSQSIREWEQYEWKIAKKDKNVRPDWTIHRRKIKNTAFWEYKVESELTTSTKEAATWFRNNIYNLAKGSNSKKYPTYKMLKESKDSLLTYVIYNEPFPFKDTEMCVRYVFHTNDYRNIGIEWAESWKDCSHEPNQKLKRVETFRGSIRLLSEPNNTTKVIQKVQFDPKGMPMWLVNPMVVKFLKKELKKFKSIDHSIKDYIY